MSKTEQTPRLLVGDLVSFAHGTGNVLAKVLEDRGCLGVRGQRIYRVEPLNRPGWTDPVEVPEDEIKEAIIMGESFVPQMSAFPPALASNLLRNLLRRGCVVESEIHGDETCFYCGNDPDGHARDCPYLEAIILHGDPNATVVPGIMNG